MKMEAVIEEGEEEEYMKEEEPDWNYDEVDVTQLCRICANPNEYLIPIFQGEGLEHELRIKISKHLPIKVTESDKLPTQLCYQCASTLIAWHDMVIGCLEANEKLKVLFHDEEKETEVKDSGSNNKDSQQISEVLEKELNETEVPQTEAMETNHEIDEMKSTTTNEVDSVVVEEEVTSFEPGLEEEVTSDSRSLSFRNYQIATWALRDKLLRLSDKTSKAKLVKRRLAKCNKTSTNVVEPPRENRSDITREDSGSSSTSSEIKQNRSKHKCNYCSRSFNRGCDLKRHNLVHLNMEEFETKGSRNVNEFQSSPIVTFTCEVCARVFKMKDSYVRHKRIHTGERPYLCAECSKRFKDSGALSRHVREVHARVRSHRCDLCGKWFMNRATLEDHRRSHTGERPYICHQCGLMFKSRAALHQHDKTHSDLLPHGCVYCSKRFRRRQDLIAHIPVHTNEKSHICEKCGRGFGTRSELHRHIAVHSDEKPFPCHVCGLNFSQKRYLRNHVKSRHGRTDDISDSGIVPLENLGFA